MSTKKKDASPAADYDVRLQVGTLVRALSPVSRAVPSRTVLPVLGCILFDAANGLLRLTATDLEIGITQFVGAEVAQPLRLAVPKDILTDALRGLPDDALLSLRLNAKTQTLTYETPKPYKRVGTVKGIDAQEFPLIGYEPELTSAAFTLPANVVTAALERVKPAIAVDEARPTLHGMHFNLKADGTLILEGTDGFRIHIEELPVPVKDHARNVILPLKGVTEVVKLIDREDDLTVDFVGGATPNRVVFTQPGWQMTAQLVEGDFPDLAAVTPRQSKITCQTPWEALKKAILGGNGYAKQCAMTGRFRLHGGDSEQPGQLDLIIKSAEYGDYTAELDAQVQGTHGFEFACNVEYLRDALEALEASQVSLGLNSPTSPIVIREQGFTAVVMPMHLGK